MKPAGTLKRLALILLLVVLLPALFYSGYELSSLGANEKIIATIYGQQLDAILFSINQYAWDVATNWAGLVKRTLSEEPGASPDTIRAAFSRFLVNNPSIEGIWLADTSLANGRSYSRPRVTLSPDSGLGESLARDREMIRRLLRFDSMGYRKIEPVRLGAGGAGQRLALVFVVSLPGSSPTIAAIVPDGIAFVREVLSPKLQDAAGQEFSLAVLQRGSDRPLYATSPVRREELKQTRDLWLLPEYSLGIRLRGTTIEDLVQARFYRNLILILGLDIVLIIGALLVYRNMRREMEFVRMKSDFISNISHELRTPLSLIRVFAETLEMDRVRSEEKKREYYTTILQESERLTRLVNNILNFSKLEAGKRQYRFEETDLNAIVSEVLATYKIQLTAEGFEPMLQLDPALPKIVADREAVSEAVINVIDNAVKYSKKEKFLRIRSGGDSSGVFLEFEDHGVGIEKKDRERIFETFYRVHDGLVHDVKGSGLGLAIVKYIAEAHGGDVTVESAPGKGSTFRLIFPIQRNG